MICRLVLLVWYRVGFGDWLVLGLVGWRLVLIQVFFVVVFGSL